MTFETFRPALVGRVSSFKKRVTISRTGLITLNVASTRKHFAGREYAILMYDAESRRVAIKPAAPEEEDTCKLTTGKTGSAHLSGRGFLGFYELPHDQTTSYPAEWLDELDALVISLDDENAKVRKAKSSS